EGGVGCKGERGGISSRGGRGAPALPGPSSTGGGGPPGKTTLLLPRPPRRGNRHYIEEMYEHRYQRQIGQMIALGWRLLRLQEGGLAVLYYYAMMHLAAIADRTGLVRVADALRARIPRTRVEAGCSALLRGRFHFVVTEVGGCAVDIDNEHDYDAARARFEVWRARQRARAEALFGPPSLDRGGSRETAGA